MRYMVKDKKKGFTLVELISVLCILGVIMVLVIPKGMKQQENAKKTAIKAEVKAIVDVATTLKNEGYFKDTHVNNIKLSALFDHLSTDQEKSKYFETIPTRIKSNYYYLSVRYMKKLQKADLNVINLAGDGESLGHVTNWDSLPE